MIKYTATILTVLALLAMPLPIYPTHTAVRDFTFFIERTIYVYENIGDEEPAAIVSPQYVTVRQQYGDWLQISTWRGPMWFDSAFVPPLLQSEIDPSRPMIAITFDDGPNGYAMGIMDVFEAYDARATFFVLGRNIEHHHMAIERMYRNGFEVAGHTWDHPYLTSLTPEEVATAIIEPHEALEQLLDTSIPPIIRPPHGAYNDTVRRVARELGFAIIHWSVCVADWERPCHEDIAYRVIRDTRDGDIILLHDIHSPTAASIEIIVPELVARGFQLVTVSDLMYHRGVELTPGQVYRRALP